METMQELFGILPQVGRLEWIGLRSTRLGEIAVVKEAVLVNDRGLQGDHKVTGRAGTKTIHPLSGSDSYTPKWG